MANYADFERFIEQKIVRDFKNNYPGRTFEGQQELRQWMLDNDPVKHPSKNTARYEADYVTRFHPELLESRSHTATERANRRMEIRRSYGEWRDNTGNVRENTIKQYKLEGYRLYFSETKGLRVWKEGWKRRISLSELEQRRTAGKRSAAKRKSQ